MCAKDELILFFLGDSLSFDATFKSVKKATLVNSKTVRINFSKGGLLTVINEHGEILAWVSDQLTFFMGVFDLNGVLFL